MNTCCCVLLYVVICCVPSHSVAFRYLLSKPKEYVMIPVYLLHGKGGKHASHGRISHGRGGIQRVTGIDRYHLQATQAEEIGRLQNPGGLAYQARRSEPIPGTTQKHQQLRGTDVLSVAPRLPLISFRPIGDNLTRCYLASNYATTCWATQG